MKKNKLYIYGTYVIFSLGILACGKTEPSGHANEQSDPPKVESAPKSQPSSGWDVGSGGDAYSGEFVEIANEIATILEMQTIKGLTSEIFRTAIKNTKIISKDMVELDQRAVDAANFPYATPPRIEVNRTGWLRMKNEKHNKVFLVLHEYLGIL